FRRTKHSHRRGKGKRVLNGTGTSAFRSFAPTVLKVRVCVRKRDWNSGTRTTIDRQAGQREPSSNHQIISNLMKKELCSKSEQCPHDDATFYNHHHLNTNSLTWTA